MITCRELTDALVDLMADELSPEARSACERHLHDCPPCVLLLESYRLTVQLARRLPRLPLSAEQFARLRVALEAARPGAYPGEPVA